MFIRRMICLLIAAALLIVSAPLTTACTALAADCALCGRETPEELLCTDCLVTLLQQEAPASPVTLTAEPQADGSVLLQWTDEGDNGPYAVRYELVNSAPQPFGWTAATATEDPSCLLTQLAPGVDYVLTVEDRAGNAARILYESPDPGRDGDIGARIRVRPVVYRNREYVRISKLSAARISAPGAEPYGLYVRLTYSMLRADRHYRFHLTLTAPNGFTDVIYSGTLTLMHGATEVEPWGFVPLTDYFACLKNHWGGIPAGRYTASMYFDGRFVYSEGFTIDE